MSVHKLIAEIIDNFYKQQQLYLQIADLSCDQFEILADEHWLGRQEELDEMLRNRQAVNEEIDGLNNHNRFLQGQVNEQLGMPEFVLSGLASNLEKEQYEILRDVVDGLGDILGKINATDEQNHVLIKKQAGINRLNPQINRRQAQNAYQQAVQQGKKG